MVSSQVHGSDGSESSVRDSTTFSALEAVRSKQPGTATCQRQVNHAAEDGHTRMDVPKRLGRRHIARTEVRSGVLLQRMPPT